MLVNRPKYINNGRREFWTIVDVMPAVEVTKIVIDLLWILLMLISLLTSSDGVQVTLDKIGCLFFCDYSF